MRVFVAGATGAVGTPLVAQLVAGGHEVIGMTRSAQKADSLRALGAYNVVLADGLERAAVIEAVTLSKPEVVTHEHLGEICEPMELVTIDVPDTYIGIVTERLAPR